MIAANATSVVYYSKREIGLGILAILAIDGMILISQASPVISVPKVRERERERESIDNLAYILSRNVLAINRLKYPLTKAIGRSINEINQSSLI